MILMKSISFPFLSCSFNNISTSQTSAIKIINYEVSIPVGSATHAIVSCTVWTTDDHRDLGHIGTSNCSDHLGSILGDSTSFILPTHHEAWNGNACLLSKRFVHHAVWFEFDNNIYRYVRYSILSLCFSIITIFNTKLIICLRNATIETWYFHSYLNVWIKINTHISIFCVCFLFWPVLMDGKQQQETL